MMDLPMAYRALGRKAHSDEALAALIAIYTPEENRPRQIEVITGWAAQFPRLAPAGRK